MAAEDDELDADLVDREPVNCVTVNRIRRTDIIDDNNILFYMRGGKIYRNYMQRKCPRLKSQDSFTYVASDGDLTSSVAVTVTITVNPVNDAPEANDDAYVLGLGKKPQTRGHRSGIVDRQGAGRTAQG